MQARGLGTAYLQSDPQHETGTATVSIDAEGQPSFTIKESVAWDFLEVDSRMGGVIQQG